MKFAEVLRRARLDESSAQYVLKSKLLPNTPATGRGRHREFSFEQAFRFALATLLVMGGMRLRDAVAVAGFCIEQLSDAPLTWDSWRKYRQRAGRFRVRLLVLDAEMVLLRRLGWGPRSLPDLYFSIRRGEVVDVFGHRQPISRHVIQLTRLAWALRPS